MIRGKAIQQLRPMPHNNFFCLLAALMVLAFLSPVMAVQFGVIGGVIADVSVSLALVAALWSLNTSRPVFLAGLALITAYILATIAWMLLDQPMGHATGHLAALAFLALTAAQAIRAILQPGAVNLNKLVGAVCVYLLLGVTWSEAYQLLHYFDPASFSGVEQHMGHALAWRFLYFSFVTLSTLGYGDVLPLTIYAQTLTVMETVIGQIYLAVLVAALVSAYLRDGKKDQETQL